MGLRINNDKGFSLIELLAVLIILGTVFAFVIPKFLNFDSNAEAKKVHYEVTAEDRFTIQTKGILDGTDSN